MSDRKILTFGLFALLVLVSACKESKVTSVSYAKNGCANGRYRKLALVFL